MRDAAAAEDQHALVAQRRQRPAERELRRRRIAGDEGQRQDRDVGVGEQITQRGPGAVVETAFVELAHRQPGLAEQLRNTRRQRRRTGRVVAQAVQTRIETAEIVDRVVAGAGQQQRGRRRGMRRDDDDRGRPAESRQPGAPSRCMKAPAAPGSSAIIGEPCETNREGSGVVGFMPVD